MNKQIFNNTPAQKLHWYRYNVCFCLFVALLAFFFFFLGGWGGGGLCFKKMYLACSN